MARHTATCTGGAGRSAAEDAWGYLKVVKHVCPVEMASECAVVCRHGL